MLNPMRIAVYTEPNTVEKLQSAGALHVPVLHSTPPQIKALS